MSMRFEQTDVPVTRFVFGRGAGRELDRRIQRAQRSVFVVSPYIDAQGIAQLLALHRRGVKVCLLTSSEVRERLWGSLITQRRHVDEAARRTRRRSSWATAATGLGIVLTAVALMVWVHAS